jgi:pyridoxine 4-dehydrogenase
MAAPTRTLANGQVAVGEIGYGAMNLTWRPTQTPDEQAFAVIKKAVDLNGDALTMVNCEFCILITSARESAHRLSCLAAGEFYGQPPHGTLGLELLSRFFAAEPSYASRIFLSVKGGITPQWKPDSSLENLRKSVENINGILKHRKMDLFEPARVDTSRPIEEVGGSCRCVGS